MLVQNRLQEVLAAAEVVVQGGAVTLTRSLVEIAEGDPIDAALGEDPLRRRYHLSACRRGSRIHCISLVYIH
jgi:hypothetical protein